MNFHIDRVLLPLLLHASEITAFKYKPVLFEMKNSLFCLRVYLPRKNVNKFNESLHKWL